MSGSRIAITTKPEFIDPHSHKLQKTIKEFLGLQIEAIKISRIYSIHKQFTPDQLTAIASGPLVDPITEIATTEMDSSFDWIIEVGFKKGVTDNAGMTAKTTIEDFIGISFQENETVKSSTQYSLKGQISYQDAKKIAEELLGNTLIEEITIHGDHCFPLETIDINISDDSLIKLSKTKQLVLNLQEMQAIKEYYSRPDVLKERSIYGLPPNPTDVELEALAQTWSEHCKHKIFNAKITYTENGTTKVIDSLFKTYIKKATEELSNKIHWLVSVFSDNAGIIRFNHNYNLAFKVETHNSPSALDPYGGALTGILGVNRDIMGAGVGARLVANTDIFCFAPLDFDGPIPKRLLHPKRVYEGVRLGVEHGGNKSGVPTVNGTVVFDKRYLGKPLVYCGTVGIMPATINGKPTHEKEILPNDLIVIAGGRTGKDGIHGATFSSEELHSESPSSAVQIGDPFTQKKLHDFLIEARDKGLYRTITDNGAGGFSSSVGELAQLSGGCEIHLDKALLKYPGLLPWEILLSESQERMTLAVDPQHEEQLKKLAGLHEVEIYALGTFTNSGNLHVLYEGYTVGLLSLEFLHNGLPQMELEAEWKAPNEEKISPYSPIDHSSLLHNLLSRYNICSKESIVRQYDHEVQGGSALKPLVGRHNDGPSDAAIIRPIECLNGKEGVVISNGICPRYSDIDAYHMAACAIDEAIRNAVAVGCDPKRIAILDNFCWPDPVGDPHKCAQLVRANQALYDTSIAFETPIISGKDSMKNDYKIDDIKISVPPTLLISAIGKIQDVEKAVSMDVKSPGDKIYILGLTKNELGCSEYALMMGLESGAVPKVDTKTAKTIYEALFEAIQKELVASCHDCSDGGLAVALAETAFAGALGVTIDLSKCPAEGIDNDTELLFSESPSRFIVTIPPEHASSFEAYMVGCPCAQIGEVREDAQFIIGDIIHDDIRALKASWQRVLR